jgi:Protein of unknown function (DUF992)
VFGSSRTPDCLFTRTDGNSERYEGTARRYGVEIGFTRHSRIVWAVFAPAAPHRERSSANMRRDSTGDRRCRRRANVLLGGSSNQFTLQPVSVEGSVGLNAAAGVAAVSLRKVP